MNQEISFAAESDLFLKTVQTRVNSYLKSNGKSKFGNSQILVKNLVFVVCFLSLYTSLYYLNSFWLVCLCFTLLGPLTIIIAINVVHDAVHDVAHSNKRINNLLTYQLDLLGCNSYTWKHRHKIGHHSFPNILNHDPDLNQSAIARIFPNSKKLGIHKFQHIYVPFLYAFYTINWIFIRDFTDFFSKKSELKHVPFAEYMKFIFFKCLYVITFYVCPYFFIRMTFGEILMANFLMQAAASYFLTLALVPSHVSDESEFPLPDEHGKLPYSWSHHQVITTTDFATESIGMSWVLGGFNHHIAHHLFPSISHVHYPALTPIVRQTIQEFGLPYNHEKSLFSAYAAHYRLLKKNAQ